MTEELKKWCIEQAIAAGAQGDQVLTQAEKLYEFAKDQKDGFKPISSAKSLSKPQKNIIQAMKEMHANGETVNGTVLGQKLDISQSYASAILRKLIDLGYVEQSGYTYTLLKDAS